MTIKDNYNALEKGPMVGKAKRRLLGKKGMNWGFYGIE
jgi:hypothetical protein